MSNWFRSFRSANIRLLFDLLMIFLLLPFCRATVQPFLTEDDFQRASFDENTTHLTEEDFKNAEKYNQLLTRNRGVVLSFHIRSTFEETFVVVRNGNRWINIRGYGLTLLTHVFTSFFQRPNRPSQKSGVRRNGVISTVKKWPQARVPYLMSTQYNERERAVLARAFQEYHRQTCIRFAPKDTFDRDYLYIGKIDGCYSDVGKAGGRQELSLDDGCMQYDTIIHELMHSIGFYHEHERWDRDHFIQILWQNIDREAYDQFGRVDLTESSYYGEGYDYRSIMHYDSLAFSKNGRETLVARLPAMTRVIGSAIDFSPIDLVKIQRMYACSAPVEQPVPTTSLISELQSFALPRVETPWSSMPISNHVEQSSSPQFPRAQPESTTTDEPSAAVCADRSTLCWRWLDRQVNNYYTVYHSFRCRSVFFEKIMREFCAQSCGFCTPQSTRTFRSYSDGTHRLTQVYPMFYRAFG